ncbi:HupE/UreJ family protein [Maricaulis sp.]|uniref:HupE/UreJ family protein n=1 Tax=Maricaulis sp. TaxID=1486257 RepID=UPI0025C0B612|nr:HupE/UreJ family protein [Maricaulis sp.]
MTGEFLLDARQATLFLASLPPGTSLEAAFRMRLAEGLQVRRDNQPCRLSSEPAVRLLGDGRLQGFTDWLCDAGAGPVEIDVQVYSPFSPNHVHFLQARMIAGERQEFVLTRGNTLARLSATGEPLPFIARLGRYALLGVTHILAGPDHLAFLLALLLVVANWRQILAATAGFTLGHSATLGLAYLGWISPPSTAIEALIGFSILFVAAEAAFLARRPERRTVVLVFAALVLMGVTNTLFLGTIPITVWLGLAIFTGSYLAWLNAGGDVRRTVPAFSAGFGLIHGVGFAGILLELELPRGDQVAALLGFNLGVEIGQVVFVSVIGLAWLFSRRFLPAWLLANTRLGAIALLSGAGCYWFVARAWA